MLGIAKDESIVEMFVKSFCVDLLINYSTNHFNTSY